MSLKVAMVGCGVFAQSFIPLFKAHPLTSKLVLCDLHPEKLQAAAEKFGVSTTCNSLEQALESDIDAVVIITQPWLHAKQAIQALRAGKHVWSAVPTGMRVDEIRQLVDAVEQSRRIYMLAETSYYYPQAIYCRRRFSEGAFGPVVYGEAEYYHDWSHGLEDVMKWRSANAGLDWRKQCGDPPMYYPTHSTSLIVSVTGAHMTHVSCQGFVDRAPDTVFDPKVNIWKNAFSNESALFRMSDGSIARLNEFRRVGHPGAVRVSLYGTEGSFESNVGATVFLTKDPKSIERLDELLTCVPSLSVGAPAVRATVGDGNRPNLAPIHDASRLPRSFAGMPNGHHGSHQFLVNDFLKACASNTLPPNNVWQAARYAIPGIVAHESSMQGGKLLEIPDLGDPGHWP